MFRWGHSSSSLSSAPQSPPDEHSDADNHRVELLAAGFQTIDADNLHTLTTPDQRALVHVDPVQNAPRITFQTLFQHGAIVETIHVTKPQAVRRAARIAPRVQLRRAYWQQWLGGAKADICVAEAEHMFDTWRRHQQRVAARQTAYQWQVCDHTQPGTTTILTQQRTHRRRRTALHLQSMQWLTVFALLTLISFSLSSALARSI
jgi:hypothetical protein